MCARPSAKPQAERDRAMSTYTPASSLGWLDFDAAGSERVATLLRALEEPGTLDPLGLGSVRDVFSAMLCPGTSTIQTRLRYFIFLPWIFRRIEEERVPPAEFRRRLRDDEARLIDCLRHLGSNQGIIGYAAGRNLKRMPSEVYWGGLGEWGIRRRDLSLAQYGQVAAALGQLDHYRDDDGYATASAVPMWGWLPLPPDDFLRADISFELRREEALVLVDHIRREHPQSLLAFLCGKPDLSFGLAFPWELPSHEIPGQLAEILRHARCFSELTVGPQHVYNILLARKANEEFDLDTAAIEASELEGVEGWIELIAGRYDDLSSWAHDLGEFWSFLGEHTVGLSTKDFVGEMVSSAITNTAGFAEDPIVHQRIREREIRLKSKRARLAHKVALENWNLAPFGGQLNYRWPIASSYLADIAAGLKASD